MEMPVNTDAAFSRAVACGCHDDFLSAVLVNNPRENYQHFFRFRMAHPHLSHRKSRGALFTKLSNLDSFSTFYDSIQRLWDLIFHGQVRYSAVDCRQAMACARKG
jgi:hypothetical protein